MNISKQDAYIKNDSPADVERLIEILSDNEELLENSVLKMVKKVKDLDRKIIEQKSSLKVFFQEHGIPTNNQIFAENIGDAIVPDTAPKESANYLDINTARTNNFPLSMLMQLKKINQDNMSEFYKKIRNIYAEIQRFQLEKSRLEEKIEKTRNLLAKAQNKKSDSQLYRQNRDKLYKIFQILQLTNEFLDLFESYPESYTTPEAVKNQEIDTADFCILYVFRKKRLLTDLNKFKSKYPEHDADFKISDMINLLESFPKQFTKAASDINTYKNDLKNIVDILLNGRIVALGKLKAAAGTSERLNDEYDNLAQRVLQVFESPVRASNVENINKEQEDGENESIFERSQEAVETVKRKLQHAGDNIELIVNEVRKSLRNRMANIKGFGLALSQEPDTYVEDYWRDKVRRKYGGNIPFCDEVEIFEKDGTSVFIKKQNAIEVSEGVWRRKTDEEKDKYLKEYGTSETDIY